MTEGYEWCVQRPGSPIARTEWEAWLAAAPGFSVTDKVRGRNPRTGRPINARSPGAGLWTRGDGRPDAYFNFYQGRIIALEPDDEVIAKLSEIAAALGGEVASFDPLDLYGCD